MIADPKTKGNKKLLMLSILIHWQIIALTLKSLPELFHALIHNNKLIFHIHYAL